MIPEDAVPFERDAFFNGKVVWIGTGESIFAVLQKAHRGASLDTLRRRAQYRNRKGRSARSRLVNENVAYKKLIAWAEGRYGISLGSPT